MTQKPLHIGIVACSAEGAALCYRTICEEGPKLLGQAHAHPEISMHTPSLAGYIAYLDRSDLWGVSELMLASAEWSPMKPPGADINAWASPVRAGWWKAKSIRARFPRAV